MNSTKKLSRRAFVVFFFMVFMALSVVLPAQIIQPSPVPTPSPAPTPQPVPAPQPKFAVLVVGDNESDPESMHLAFRNTGDRVYSTLIAKNYTDDNILYLSWDIGNPDVDDYSTKTNISSGLQTWLRNNLNNNQLNDTVVIYFIDHGDVHTYYNKYFFVPYDAPTNLVYDFELFAWVNLALSEPDGTRNYKSANIVIETCRSGWTIAPPNSLEGPERIVVTATDGALLAYSWWAPPVIWYNNRPKDSNGEAIFSYYYLKQILAGRDVQTAFNTAYNQTVAEVIRLANLTGTGEQQNPQIRSQHPNPLRW